MKRLTRMLIAVTAGAGLAYFCTTPRGRALRARAAELLPRWCPLVGDCCCSATTTASGPEDAPSGASDAAVRAKIDETRRRLREELGTTLSRTPSAGAD